MRNEIVAQLKAPGSVRTLDRDNRTLLEGFFKTNFLSNIRSAQLHPLGFYYIKENYSENEVFRFHLWPSGSTIPESQIDSDIHDHVFELNSAIIIGEMGHETFRFKPDAEGEFEIATVTYNGFHSKMARDGTRGSVSVIDDAKFSAGQVYRLPAYTIHRARPITLPTATLVLAVTKTDSIPPTIVMPHTAQEPPPFERRLLNDEEMAIARETLSQIKI